jgi:RHS repeat-associated protein
VQAGQTSACYDGDFYPFGGERIVTNTCTQNYKFEGKERDTETGNDDFGARYYTSRLGRWLSADWSAVPAPVPYANLTNPQTLNLYAMVSDNPETFADLDGHQCGSIGSSDRNGCPTVANTKNAKSGEGFSPPPQKNGTNTPPSPTQQAQQQNQNDPEQQTIKAQQQQRQQAIDNAKGPARGSNDYVQATLGKAGQLADQQMKVLGTTMVVVETAGLAPVVATSATATTVVAATGNALNTANAAAYGASVAASAGADRFLPAGAEGVKDFVEGAMDPQNAPPTTAGLIGGTARTVADFIIDKFTH